MLFKKIEEYCKKNFIFSLQNSISSIFIFKILMDVLNHAFTWIFWREKSCPQFFVKYARDFWISCIFFMGIWYVRLRANCTINEKALRQSKDAALKFRGCFQAVCEPRSVPIGRRGGWLVRRVVWQTGRGRPWTYL